MQLRVRALTDHPVRADGSFVLYWMTATRRLAWNYALDHAISTAVTLGKPLLILEGIQVDYPWASTRHHRFILDGMAEHTRVLRGSPVGYYPYVESGAEHGSGLIEALATDACSVITDDSPVFFTPSLLRVGGRLQGVRVEAVDSCGLLPIRAGGKVFSAAYHFRRFLQGRLPDYLDDLPQANPLSALPLPALQGVADDVRARWPAARVEELESNAFLAALPVDHSVPTVEVRGGTSAARQRLDSFLGRDLSRYGDDRNHPDLDAGSGLSAWLHYGHLAAHEVVMAVADQEGWNPSRLSPDADGRREGWWGMSPSAEAFLDQLVTWRELGFGYCYFEPEYASYPTLPAWARATLEEHSADPREHLYSLDDFRDAATHDELWNAAQRQLVTDGVIHNYLRMLWGKKILEWTTGPEEALHVMIELNNRYAIDGRDPNSYSGIFWCLGRFDRGWPERAIYGKVRSMTSASTRRKVSVDRYLERWGDAAAAT